MRVWIDLANSPDPLMFAPVARALEDGGAEVLVTARDQAQTAELTLERWPEAAIVGAESPGSRPAKAATIVRRMWDLRRWAAGRGIDVALSLNSYAQILAARTLRIPCVTTMDFEYQPINHLAFRLADRILLPEALPADVVERQGARGAKVIRHGGIKESIYLGDFEPDATVLDALGVDRDAGPLVVARTPPSRAVYHHFENPLFEQALERIGAQPELTCVVLPRHREQVEQLEALGIANVVVPAVGGRLALAPIRRRPLPGRGRHDDPRGGADGNAHPLPVRRPHPGGRRVARGPGADRAASRAPSRSPRSRAAPPTRAPPRSCARTRRRSSSSSSTP